MADLTDTDQDEILTSHIRVPSCFIQDEDSRSELMPRMNRAISPALHQFMYDYSQQCQEDQSA